MEDSFHAYNASVHVYDAKETKGVIALTVAGGTSLLFILGLVLAVMVPSCRSKKDTTTSTSFIRTHVGIYFLCLLLCDFVQAVASIISLDWIAKGAVVAGPTCTAQGIMYQFANVGSALWSLTIAVHTFALLFLRIQVSGMACLSTFVGVWFVTAGIVAIGPAVVQNELQGPFHGLSGTWCWITEEYTASRLGLEYIWMFFSAFFSFILYTLVFLRLRGNISLNGWSVTFRWVQSSRAWTGSAERETVESHVLTVARQMLWYPVAYTIVILPIAVCRWTEFSGGRMSFAAIIATDVIFLLSGAVNVVLFTTTRRVVRTRQSLPIHSKSTRDITSFVLGPQGSHVFTLEPGSPTTDDEHDNGHPPGMRKTDYQLTADTFQSRLPQRTSSRSSFRDSHPGNGLFFAPASPDLHSTHSVAFSDYDAAAIPVHLRPIPIVIMTPPSPTPSQMTYATASTDRERHIAEARSSLPQLTRF